MTTKTYSHQLGKVLLEIVIEEEDNIKTVTFNAISLLHHGGFASEITLEIPPGKSKELQKFFSNLNI